MVNPPRDEIRKIRAQLQGYGQVGDANVFYWFQNRKSRSKHKLRHLQNSENHNLETQQKHHHLPSLRNLLPKELIPTKIYFQTHSESSMLPPPPPAAAVTQTGPFFFPVQHHGQGITPSIVASQEFCFSELSSVVQLQSPPQHNVGPCTSLLLTVRL